MNKISILFMAMMCFFNSLANADTLVEIFVDSPIQFKHISGTEIVMYDLSLPEQVNAQYLPEFPGDPVRAEQLARVFFASSKGKEYQAALKSAYVGQLKVAKYQVKKIPAMVFDAGRYVVYGTENPVLAHSLYIEHIQSTDPVNPEEAAKDDDHEE